MDFLYWRDHKPGQDFLMPASLWKNESIQGSQREEMKKIISLLLKGELGSEELEKLIATNPELVQKNDSPAKISPDLINLELKDKIISPESGEDSLKGILTEEGELIYFDETVIKDGEKSLKGSKDTSLKFMDQSRNKMVVEISVKDLRDSRDQSVPNIVSTHQNQVLNAAMEGKKGESLDSDVSDDILNSPAEKLFSPEGGGGKLQAPVTKEVSRLFQDYMKDTGSRDLVKKIDFILKNDNQGEIKLILKPEALGNVRINLSLNENNIAGKIFVDNSSVREIFLNNMEQISNQLRANGYNVASLDVWVGQEGQSGQKGQQELEQDKKYRSAERIKRFDQSVPQAAPGSYVNEGEVNLVV
jgi:flagellar hook-length control protein FliK